MAIRASILSIFACMFLAMCQTAGGNTRIPPGELLKANIRTFILTIDYRGPATGGKSPSLLLCVSPPPPMVTLANVERLYSRVTEDEARKIIDTVVAEGILGRAIAAGQADVRPITTGYVMKIRASGESFETDLGADLATVHHLDVLRQALDGNAAQVMDNFLVFLKDSQKKWAEEGRVFDQRGLALFVKSPPKAFPPGAPVTFNATFQNTTNRPITLSHDPANIDWWNLSIRSPQDQPEFYVVRKGRPAQPVVGQSVTIKPGDSLAVTLSLDGCQYIAKPVKLPAQIVAIDSLPGSKYTVVLATDFAAADDQAPNPTDTWTGSLVSASIAFETTAPGAVPAK